MGSRASTDKKDDELVARISTMDAGLSYIVGASMVFMILYIYMYSYYDAGSRTQLSKAIQRQDVELPNEGSEFIYNVSDDARESPYLGLSLGDNLADRVSMYYWNRTAMDFTSNSIIKKDSVILRGLEMFFGEQVKVFRKGGKQGAGRLPIFKHAVPLDISIEGDQCGDRPFKKVSRSNHGDVESYFKTPLLAVISPVHCKQYKITLSLVHEDFLHAHWQKTAVSSNYTPRFAPLKLHTEVQLSSGFLIDPHYLFAVLFVCCSILLLGITYKLLEMAWKRKVLFEFELFLLMLGALMSCDPAWVVSDWLGVTFNPSWSWPRDASNGLYLVCYNLLLHGVQGEIEKNKASQARKASSTGGVFTRSYWNKFCVGFLYIIGVLVPDIAVSIVLGRYWQNCKLPDAPILIFSTQDIIKDKTKTMLIVAVVLKSILLLAMQVGVYVQGYLATKSLDTLPFSICRQSRIYLFFLLIIYTLEESAALILGQAFIEAKVDMLAKSKRWGFFNYILSCMLLPGGSYPRYYRNVKHIFFSWVICYTFQRTRRARKSYEVKQVTVETVKDLLKCAMEAYGPNSFAETGGQEFGKEDSLRPKSIEMRSSSTASRSTEDVVKEAEFFIPNTDSFGFITTRRMQMAHLPDLTDNKTACIISIRGTTGKEEMATNLRFDLERPTQLPEAEFPANLQGANDAVKVHRGFQLAADALWEQIRPVLQKRLEAAVAKRGEAVAAANRSKHAADRVEAAATREQSFPSVTDETSPVGDLEEGCCEHHEIESIWCTGHSQGGAVATLLSMYIRNFVHENFLGSFPVGLCTFGSPRVGNLSMVHYFLSLNIFSLRVVHGDDPIPTIPSSIWGRQAGRLLCCKAEGKHMRAFTHSLQARDEKQHESLKEALPDYYCHVTGLVRVSRNSTLAIVEPTGLEEHLRWFRNALSVKTLLLYTGCAISDHMTDYYSEGLRKAEKCELQHQELLGEGKVIWSMRDRMQPSIGGKAPSISNY